MKQGKFRWAWIPGVPLMWDLIVTLTASYQKIFSDVPAIGYFANHDKFVAAKAAGEVIAPAQTMADMDKVSRNTMIQGSLSILYPLLVIIVVLVALKVCVDALRRGGLPTTEAEDVPSQIFAPRSFLPTPAEKEVLEQWRAAGLDPSPQGAGH